MCACRPLPVSLGWQGKGVNMSYGQEAHMFSAVSMSWRRATVPWKEARSCSRHGQRPCFSPQGQEVVWRLLVLGSLCWWSSTTRWWTTTSWSWPGSSTWTPICCTAHAGMCFSLFTCEATKRYTSNATPFLPFQNAHGNPEDHGSVCSTALLTWTAEAFRQLSGQSSRSVVELNFDGTHADFDKIAKHLKLYVRVNPGSWHVVGVIFTSLIATSSACLFYL